MSMISTIAAAEWRLWMRSKSALAALFAVVLIIAATSVLTAIHFTEERQERAHQQAVAEDVRLSAENLRKTGQRFSFADNSNIRFDLFQAFLFYYI